MTAIADPGLQAYPRVAARLIGRPLAVEPGALTAFLAAVGGRLGLPSLDSIEAFQPPTPGARRGFAALAGSTDRRPKPYAIVEGVAVIPVLGALVHRHDWLVDVCGMTSYQRLEAVIAEAIGDDEVEALWLDIDSPGGEVSGLQDFGRRLASVTAREGGPKPITAFVNESAYSAAYWIAAQCDTVIAPVSGGAGSIGVVCLHWDESAFLEDVGVKPTLIHAGKHKVDGNPFEALPDSVRTRIQGELEEARQRFAQAVAGPRGLDVAAVLETEAQCFTAMEALDLGLIDHVAGEDQAWAALQEELSTPGP